MIKVCHLTSVHPAEDVRIFHKECVSLARAGYDVYLVQRGDSYEKGGVHVIGAGIIPSNRILRMTIGARKVYKIAKALNCSLYHIHDPELLPFCAKLLKAGKRVIFDSHELYREQLKKKSHIGPILSRIYSCIEKRVLRKIDAVVFPCPINGKNPFEGMCNDFAYVNNVPILSELYEKYKEQNKKEDSICYLGTISYSRGVTNIIKAAFLANCKLYLAGNCHNTEYLEKLRLMPQFATTEYLGVLNREEVVQLLSKVKVGMATLLNVGQYNIADNLPTKVYEYMAMGIPSIISETPYNIKINEQYQFGVVVNPDSPDEIARAINELLSDSRLYDEKARNGRRAIVSKFCWEKEQNYLLDLYSRVLNNNI